MKTIDGVEEYFPYLAHYHLAKSVENRALLLHYEKGEYLCYQDEPLYYFSIIVRGRVKVSTLSKNGKRLLLCFMSVKDTLCDMELLLDNLECCTCSVIAVCDTDCIGIPIQYCAEELRKNVLFSNVIGHEVAVKMLRASQNDIVNRLNVLNARICAYIDQTQENGLFTEKMTDLAELLGVDYRSLIRGMHSLCQDDVLLKTSRNQYMVKDFSRLRKLAQDSFFPIG